MKAHLTSLILILSCFYLSNAYAGEYAKKGNMEFEIAYPMGSSLGYYPPNGYTSATSNFEANDQEIKENSMSTFNISFGLHYFMVDNFSLGYSIAFYYLSGDNLDYLVFDGIIIPQYNVKVAESTYVFMGVGIGYGVNVQIPTNDNDTTTLKGLIYGFQIGVKYQIGNVLLSGLLGYTKYNLEYEDVGTNFSQIGPQVAVSFFID